MKKILIVENEAQPHVLCRAQALPGHESASTMVKR
jgi:hypothetical protein